MFITVWRLLRVGGWGVSSTGLLSWRPPLEEASRQRRKSWELQVRLKWWSPGIWVGQCLFPSMEEGFITLLLCGWTGAFRCLWGSSACVCSLVSSDCPQLRRTSSDCITAGPSGTTRTPTNGPCTVSSADATSRTTRARWPTKPRTTCGWRQACPPCPAGRLPLPPAYALHTDCPVNVWCQEADCTSGFSVSWPSFYCALFPTSNSHSHSLEPWAQTALSSLLAQGESESEVTQSYPTLCDPVDCSLPGSSIHGISQARVLEWGAVGTNACVSFGGLVEPGVFRWRWHQLPTGQAHSLSVPETAVGRLW